METLMIKRKQQYSLLLIMIIIDKHIKSYIFSFKISMITATGIAKSTRIYRTFQTAFTHFISRREIIFKNARKEGLLQKHNYIDIVKSLVYISSHIHIYDNNYDISCERIMRKVGMKNIIHSGQRVWQRKTTHDLLGELLANVWRGMVWKS